jgi:transposase
VLDAITNEHRFETITTSPSAVADLLGELKADVLIIEACSIAGWVFDLATSLGIAVRVANANGEAVLELIKEVDLKLDAIQTADARVVKLKTIPGVGPRLAELVVATIDDARRFKTAGQVGAYAGLVPKQYQSGQMNRQGRITGQGPGLLRRVLVQVAWGMQRREGYGKIVFERLCHGQRTRRKQAVVALARRILVWCWAMLRDQSVWKEPKPMAPA